MSIPATLKAVRKDLGELRADSSAAGEALAAILHKLDRVLKLLRDRGPSGPSSKGKVRDAARTNR
jgi:hypothetical protein